MCQFLSKLDIDCHVIEDTSRTLEWVDKYMPPQTPALLPLSYE
jgi:hypothetical protein